MITSIINRHILFNRLIAFLISLFFSALANADTVDIVRIPPELSTTVDPNLLVTFDDSGSMANQFMGDTRPFDFGTWSGRWECAGVIDPSVTDSANPRSKVMNGVYYNPNINYVPPSYEDGTSFPNAAYSGAWDDGVDANRPSSPTGATTKTNLSASTWQCIYDKASGTANPVGGGGYYYVLKAGVDPTNLAQLYTNANWLAVKLPAAQQQNFANWWSYYHDRNLMTRTAVSRAFAKFHDVHVAWQNINAAAYLLPANTVIQKFVNPHRANFFNWVFQVGASGSTPDRAALIRAGEFFKRTNTGDTRDPYWEPTVSKELICRQNFSVLVTDGFWNEGNPTKPTGFFDVHTSRTLPDGKSYNNAAPESKVFWNVPVSPTGSCSASGSSDCYPSMADIAFYYWATDLRPDLQNGLSAYFPDNSTGVTAAKILTPIADPASVPEIYFNPANDPATWQHVTQFLITLGVPGKLTYPTDGTALRTGTKSWTQPKRDAPEAIDDTWHAAVNSRGKYLSATNPQEVVDGLNAIISNIIRRRSSASATIVSSPVISGNSTLGYSTGYDSSDWSGAVTASIVRDNGLIEPIPSRDSGCILTGGPCATTKDASSPPARDPNSRVIITSNSPTGGGIPFRYSSLSAQQQTWLNIDPATGSADGKGSLRVDYLRGDRTQEKASVFRDRGSVLGAVVNSSARLVSFPDTGLTDTFPMGSPEAVAFAADKANSYETFAYNYRNRAKVIYVGANDGMMHAFSADDGRELWAYVPYAASQNLNALTNDTSFTYRPYVDSTPVVSDAFFNGSWHTLLAGSLRFGGKGVYVLDITDPTNVSEVGAASLVKWEFSKAVGATAANLGYTFGRPNIVRLRANWGGNNGTWVVLVPSGYFPDPTTSAPQDPADATDPARLNKTSSLFVLDAATGAVIKELKTPTGITSYGLGTTGAADYNADQIADFAVAGDLVGNIWRFDLADPDPNQWRVDQLFQPAKPTDSTKLGQSGQAVTVQPIMFADPVSQKLTVVFGTGKYIGTNDRTTLGSDVIQSFYGIRENGPAKPAITAAMLTKQTLTQSGTLRRLTQTAVPASSSGWTFDLPTTDEINVTTLTPLYDSGRAVLTTLLRNSNDPCVPTRKGAIMLIDATSGGAPLGPVPLSSGGNPLPVGTVGSVVLSPPIGDPVTPATTLGGGKVILPGITLDNGAASPTIFSAYDSYWRRRAWRELFQPQG